MPQETIEKTFTSQSNQASVHYLQNSAIFAKMDYFIKTYLQDGHAAICDFLQVKLPQKAR